MQVFLSQIVSTVSTYQNNPFPSKSSSCFCHSLRQWHLHFCFLQGSFSMRTCPRQREQQTRRPGDWYLENKGVEGQKMEIEQPVGRPDLEGHWCHASACELSSQDGGSHAKFLSRAWMDLLSFFDYFSSVIFFLNFLSYKFHEELCLLCERKFYTQP